MTTLASLSPALARSSSPLNSAAQQRNSADAQNALTNRLAERLGLEPGALKGKSEAFAPSKVADTVLGFIEQRLQSAQANGGDTAELEKLLSQARKGVEKGFEEARKILDGMGVLKGKIAEDIDTTYNKIQDGLNALEKGFLPDRASGGSSTEGVTGSGQRLTAKSETFDMEIKTRDGDRLKVSVAQASANWSNTPSADGKSITSGSLQIGGWQVEVEGELDEGERKALEDLFGQVQDISNKFYSGDLNGAFDRAMQLDMDSEQLASMSLRLTQTSVRQASDAYGSVAEQGGQPASAVNGTLADYAKSLLDALRSTDQITADAKGTLEQLLEGGFSLDERFDQAALEKAKTLNERLLDGMQGLVEPAAKGVDAPAER